MYEFLLFEEKIMNYFQDIQIFVLLVETYDFSFRILGSNWKEFGQIIVPIMPNRFLALCED